MLLFLSYCKGFARSRANQEKGSTAPRVLIYYILWCTDSTGVPFSQQLTQDPRAVRTCRRRVGRSKNMNDDRASEIRMSLNLGLSI